MQTSPYVHKFVDEIHLVLQETVRAGAGGAQRDARQPGVIGGIGGCCSCAELLCALLVSLCLRMTLLCWGQISALQVREAARRSVLTEAGVSDLASAGGKNMVRSPSLFGGQLLPLFQLPLLLLDPPLTCRASMRMRGTH